MKKNEKKKFSLRSYRLSKEMRDGIKDHKIYKILVA